LARLEDALHGGILPQARLGAAPYNSWAMSSTRDPADYLDFQAPNDIRLKGHRIGIETVLFAHLEGMIAEEIAFYYPTLSVEEILAVIAYYGQRDAAGAPCLPAAPR